MLVSSAINLYYTPYAQTSLFVEMYHSPRQAS